MDASPSPKPKTKSKVFKYTLIAFGVLSLIVILGSLDGNTPIQGESSFISLGFFACIISMFEIALGVHWLIFAFVFGLSREMPKQLIFTGLIMMLISVSTCGLTIFTG